MARFGHEHLKRRGNGGKGHADFSEERSQRIKAGGLGEVEGTHSILVAAETQQVLGWLACALATFDVEDARGWGGEPVGVRRSCFGFALLAPECIAGSVKKDEPSLGIGIGHRGVGLTANQAGVRQGSFNADPPYPLRGRKSPACQR